MSISQYRADIDGLRAVAVLSVIIFHLNAAWMPSGFLGVDVFFVISGYLITSIIYRDIRRGDFSFKDFYLRRIKRILPAFFVVLFIALLIGIYVMPIQSDFGRLKNSALASTLFAANLYFMRGGGYFDPKLEDKPLLHIWSLSVEEQFYFVFPILLILLLRYDWTRRNKYPILLALGALTLGASFINLGDYGITWDTYYMPHLRVPEMLVGSLLAMASTDGLLARTLNLSRANLLSVLCLAILFVCFFLGGIFVPPFFPGFASLIPCVAVAGLIYLNSQPTWVSSLLSNGFVVWIGKISYSLYLWHWVVLAWMRYVYGTGPLGSGQLVLSCVLMLGFSVLSYYFVEQPTRHQRVGFGKSFALYYLTPAALLLLFYLMPEGLYGKQYLPDEYSKVQPSHGTLFDTVEGEGLLGVRTKAPTVLIAGDSHTAHLDAFFDYVAKHEGWCAYASAASSNPFFFDYVFQYKGTTEAFAEKRNKFLSERYQNYDTIVLSVYWGKQDYAKDATFVPALDKALRRLAKEGKRVCLVNSHYEVDDARLKEYWLGSYGLTLPEKNYRGESYAVSKATSERVKAYVAQHFPEVRWIDLEPYLPSNLMIGVRPALADNNHLNSYGAEYVARRFVEDGRRLIEPTP